MDVRLLRAALGSAPAAVVVGATELHTSNYAPNSVDPPHWYPAEVELDYHAGASTFNGQPVIEAVCMVLTAEQSNDQEGQYLLDAYLSHPASTSIKAAVESDQSLGGICKSVFVHNVDGYRLYTVGQSVYYGARFRVQILGG